MTGHLMLPTVVKI